MSPGVVIDNSALVVALTDVGPTGVALRARLHEVDSLNAPTLLDYELLAALFGMRRGGKLIDAQVENAIAAYKLLDVIHHRMLELWKRVQELYSNLSAYDAQYVALAEALDLPLITCDARIARSGAAKCAVEVFA
jgi:predicted nucleic acid-binding protein